MKLKKKYNSKILALTLALSLAFSLLPGAAFADEDSAGEGGANAGNPVVSETAGESGEAAGENGETPSEEAAENPDETADTPGESETADEPSVDPSEPSADPSEPEAPDEPVTPVKKHTIPKLESFTNESGKSIPSGVKNVIIKYHDTFYEALANLESMDVTQYFAPKRYENAAVTQAALDLLIEERKIDEKDLGMTGVRYSIRVTAVTKMSSERYVITIRESGKMHFNFITESLKAQGKDPNGILSQVINVYENFDIVKTSKGWKIRAFYRNQNFFVNVRNAYNALKLDSPSKSKVKSSLKKIKADKIEKYKAKYASNEALRKTANTKTLKAKSADHKYNRTKAVSWAKSHVTTRTKVDYSNMGGNCQNYASNMLLAGGIPMDHKGDYQWKHYSMVNNYKHVKKGRTASFICVSPFYTYAKNNRGYGLVAKVDVNPYYGRGGDVVQIGGNGYYSHTEVVIGTVKDSKGKVLDVLLNSNTIDLKNYPMSCYLENDIRCIKIYGWND